MQETPLPPEPETSRLVAKNFNEPVLVKITEAGEKQWGEYWRSLGIEVPPLSRNEAGLTSIQLTDLAHIFGPKLTPTSGDEQPIEMKFFIELPQ